MKNKLILGLFFMVSNFLMLPSHSSEHFSVGDEQPLSSSYPCKSPVSIKGEKKNKGLEEIDGKQKKTKMVNSQNIGQELDNLQKEVKEVFKAITPAEYEPFPEIYEAELVLNKLKDFRNTLIDTHNIIKEGKKFEYKQLKKKCRQLGNAIDNVKEFNFRIKNKANELKSRFPHYSDSTYSNLAKVLISFKEWEKRHDVSSPEKENQEEFFLKTLEDKKIEFLIFVCPPTDFRLLNSSTPEEYLQVSIEKSFLPRHITRLSALLTSLKYTELEVSLLALIGDHDEEDYIWPTLGKPKLDEEKLKIRRNQLKEAVAFYLSTKLPDISVKAFSLASYLHDSHRNVYNEVRKDITRFFDQNDQDEEKKKMSFLLTQYYMGLPFPKPEQLEEIVKNKFATYAMHGAIAHSCNPRLILIQTEAPPLLRTKMINAGRHQEPLPVIYLPD